MAKDKNTDVKDAQAETAKGNETAQAPQVKRGPAVAKRSAKKEAEEMQDPEVKIESALNRTEEYLHRNGKTLLTILTVIVLLVAGFFAYKYLILGKRQDNAGAAMFTAEQLFQLDSFDLALNGDGNNAGFLEVIEKYGSTPQANIAHHYAGVCYFKMGDNDNALKYLAEYSTSNGAPNQVINALNKGLQGDILSQKGDYDKAAAMYGEAVKISDNSLTAPMYLKKLGLVYMKQGNSKAAIETFTRIKEDFPGSLEGRDIDKYLGIESQK